MGAAIEDTDDYLNFFGLNKRAGDTFARALLQEVKSWTSQSLEQCSQLEDLMVKEMESMDRFHLQDQLTKTKELINFIDTFFHEKIDKMQDFTEFVDTLKTNFEHIKKQQSTYNEIQTTLSLIEQEVEKQGNSKMHSFEKCIHVGAWLVILLLVGFL